MNGLGFLNIELTSRCNKGNGTPGSGCWMCGRRKLEREFPDKANWGDMSYEMVREIEKQIQKGIVLQFHGSGDPLLYPFLGDTLHLFESNIRCFNTNGKLLIEKADEIIGNLETLTISIVEKEEGDDQYDTVCRFIEIKGIRKPYLIYRLLGKVDKPERWGRLPGIVAKRILHSPDGSRHYTKSVTIPEIGICLDLLTHLAINRFGHVSVCVRFDPEGELIIGDLNKNTLKEIWNSEARKWYIECHKEGHRDWLRGCNKCDYWGIPMG